MSDSQKIDRILSILENDDSINKIGPVHQVQKNQDKLNELLVREKIYMVKATILGSIAGAIVTALAWIGQHFFLTNK